MSRFPENKTFALTILDDTDDATLENVKPVYELLQELGMKTTKTAWPMSCPEGSSLYFAGETLQYTAYLEFVKSLVESGFELASHCATMESSQRNRTEEGLRFMAKEFGGDLIVHCNHGQNTENIYWGMDRYQILPIHVIASILRRLFNIKKYMGHIEGTPYFWGDLCQKKFKYVRNFTFNKLDISEIHSGHPYRLKTTPYVQHWFSTSDAPDVHQFNKLVNRESIDAMIRNGGHTIISTHLGKGFVRHGEVDKQVRETLSYISNQSGWFVPVSTLLDYLLKDVKNPTLSKPGQYYLELAHVGGRVKHKISKIMMKIC